MDQSSLIAVNMELSEVVGRNSTFVDNKIISNKTDHFHSIEESVTAVDVSDGLEEKSFNDETKYTSQIESLIEEENSKSQSLISDISNVNVSMDIAEASKEVIAETNENFFFKENLLEVGRKLWETNDEKQHYTKGCLWSPDGTCCLVPVHLDGMHLIELPSDLYQGEISQKRPLTKLSTAVHVKEGGTVYDCAWYPFMNSELPETCCWLASRQHEPIHMWDAFNGSIRASYRGYDDVDEIEAAISVIFSCDGENVLGGYKKCIRIFDTSIPGRSCTKLVTKQAISVFALTSNNTDIIATGSWNGVINLFDQRVPNMGSLHALFGHNGGVTFLKYSNDGQMLFSGARKDNALCLWDMRNFSKPLALLDRRVSSNQRIYFDLSPQNEWLISGDSQGFIRVWNLKGMREKRSFRAHSDSCNGVSFHPSRPIIASSGGQYHFTEEGEGRIVNYENSVVFWWIGQENY